jgi:hypothetical protein
VGNFGLNEIESVLVGWPASVQICVTHVPQFDYLIVISFEEDQKKTFLFYLQVTSQISLYVLRKVFKKSENFFQENSESMPQIRSSSAKLYATEFQCQ